MMELVFARFIRHKNNMKKVENNDDEDDKMSIQVVKTKEGIQAALLVAG